MLYTLFSRTLRPLLRVGVRGACARPRVWATCQSVCVMHRAVPHCSHRNGLISEGFVTAVRVVDYLLLRQRLQTIEPLLQQHVPSVETFVTDAPYPLDSTRGKGRADMGHHR